MLKILYTGNMGLGHDLDTIIKAISKLNGTLDLRVLFVGEGKAKQTLQKCVEQLGLHNVEFRPPVPLYKLSELMAEGDIHLVTQKNGTQGLIVPSKIYGILAAGRPSLFVGPSDCESAIIIKQSKSGYIVLPGDVDSAVDAIKILAYNETIRFRMGEQARIYYDEHFGRKRSVSRIVNAIESIV